MSPDQQIRMTVTLGQVANGQVVGSGFTTIHGDQGIVTVPAQHTLDVSDGQRVWQVIVAFETP